ncbi:polynucleotide kinase-phosphatase [Desulfonatronovibrio magnus]|uniref:polynucleotide kinase-phosphatase n=1 Tax=Desulfonatronovibrio magnus TaxID=698827 RepID=UPI0005EB1753|nr:polynucleotide kinase-phosphatase [Desulfonatronovibrio magnus]
MRLKHPNLTIPEQSLVVLAGASGSGKSTFARTHFQPSEIISSDFCRALVANDETDQSATKDAFDILHAIVRKRLSRRLLTVVDATNVRPEDRKALVTLAREFHSFAVAIVFDLDPGICLERNARRPDRTMNPRVVRRQSDRLRRSLRGLKREGFRYFSILSTPEEVQTAKIQRQRLWTDLRQDHGPFDVIGDVHGCFEELTQLLSALGYNVQADAQNPTARHPEGRKAVFLGDLVDRGPDSPSVLRLVMAMVNAGAALCLPGNHEMKLLRKLRGKTVQITHGLDKTLEQLEREPPEFLKRIREFLDGLISHYLLDGGRLVVAHAGLREDLQGRASSRVRDVAVYGETPDVPMTATDTFGLPVRVDWAAAYRGQARVVYGHTPVVHAKWVNNTICIDTGCVFGGKLTALRYPELEIVQVPTHRIHCEQIRPMHDDTSLVNKKDRPWEDLLDITDVLGKRVITSRIMNRVTILEASAAAALETISRFAVHPRWLIYLPPTMSPPETAPEGDCLEHPSQCFNYFRKQSVATVICQEKHMGSRAVIILCRNHEACQRHFGLPEPQTGAEAHFGLGMAYTRTGRPFFSQPAQQAAVLDRLRQAMDQSKLWQRLETDWICLDAEIMPWSAKALELLLTQYAPTGAAGMAGLNAAMHSVLAMQSRTSTSSLECDVLLDRLRQRRACVASYVESYGNYCWPVVELCDLKIAPFHLLATEGRVYDDKDHLWHMNILADLCKADEELLQVTPHQTVELGDPKQEQGATEWWVELTSKSAEGMVVKPLDWVVRGKRGLVQPALKCRGREYLRIIYGPEYTMPDQLERLRPRALAMKRSLALREYALSLEALHRFVSGEPSHRIHECVFGILALESTPVDSRL